jgi:hypothetical protein
MIITKKTLPLFVFMLLSMLYANGQTQKRTKLFVKKDMQVVLRDTVFNAKKDTTLVLDVEEAEHAIIRENPALKTDKFYDSLRKIASSKKITRDIFDFLVVKKGNREKTVNVIVKSEDVFKPYAGYTIASIVFKSVDLMEGSVTDTLRKSSSKLAKYVNKIHRDTRSKIIENNLLFEVGDRVDPYQLADNERILRQFRTLQDARIYISRNKSQPKAVDITVVTQDVFSNGVSADLNSIQNFRVDLYDINILGYAKQFQVSYFRNALDNPKSGYELTLRDFNFSNTFIQGEIQYTENHLRQRARISVGRDFFTPAIKYAGGVELYHTKERFYFEEDDTLQARYAENNLDLWFGRSIQIKERTNLIFAARSTSHNFIDRPYVSSDSNSFFHNRTLLLGSVTLAERNFMKGFRIRGFGRTEDISVGGLVSFIAGKEINQFINRTYLEIVGNFGRYFEDVGYFNLSLGAGSFFKPTKAEDGQISVSSTYFSNLLKIKNMQVRHFVYASYTKGINRVLDRSISIAGERRDERGFVPLGDQRLLLGYETVYFTPWYPYGFQLALFHRIDVNFLSRDFALFSASSLFPSIQIGARVLNENLVLPKFSVDLTYYAPHENYNSAWQINFSTTLINLFGTAQFFKPRVSGFH